MWRGARQPVSGGPRRSAGEAWDPDPGGFILVMWGLGHGHLGAGGRPRAQLRAASCGLTRSSARPAGMLRTHDSISSEESISSEFFLKVTCLGGGNCLQNRTGPFLLALRSELSVQRRARLHRPRSLSSSRRSGQEAPVTHGPVPSTHVGPQTRAPASWAWVSSEDRHQYLLWVSCEGHTKAIPILGEGCGPVLGDCGERRTPHSPTSAGERRQRVTGCTVWAARAESHLPRRGVGMELRSPRKGQGNPHGQQGPRLLGCLGKGSAEGLTLLKQWPVQTRQRSL